jgi:hypothetical protein
LAVTSLLARQTFTIKGEMQNTFVANLKTKS